MRRYILRRVTFTVILLFGISVLTFFLARVLPGDPGRMIAGQRASDEAVENIREFYGLNGNIFEQYIHYMGNLLQGDLGVSIVSQRAVADDLGRLLPATLELVLASLIIGAIIGIAVGLISAIRRGKATDVGSRLFASGCLSVPDFWLGILAQIVFFSMLGILPFGDRLSLGVTPPPSVTGLYTVDALIAGQFGVFIDALAHLVMPAAILMLPLVGFLIRYVRMAMLNVLSQDFIRTARAKGLSPSRIYVHHALRNAMIPALTITGLSLAFMMSGAVLVEYVFAWPGIGRFTAEAIASSDYNAIMAVTILAASAYTMVNLIIDLLYTKLDPRIRLT
ncbi:MAG: ABC transporter permease [Pseudomonadota bacterium]